jgi:hypothetical protein
LTAVTLLSRANFNEAADNGASTSDEDADLAAGYPITFATGAATSAELMGKTLPDDVPGVVCKDDLLCSYAPNAGAATGPNLTGLNGKSATGTWKFCVGDAGSSDVGTINRVTLTVTR